MPLKPRIRGRKHLGPFVVNYTHRGISSVAIKVGPFTRNLTRGTTYIDGPGIFNGELTGNRGRRQSGPVVPTRDAVKWGCAGLAALGIPVGAALWWVLDLVAKAWQAAGR